MDRETAMPALADTSRRRAGLTLTETLIALSIGAVLLGAVLPDLSDSLRRRHVEGAATQFETDFAYARGAAVATQQPLRLRFGGDASGSCYVVFAGDPAALSRGLLGEGLETALPRSHTEPRSLSAWVWSFAAVPEGPVARDLVHHNVFFPADTAREFGPLGRGEMPETPTLYICAEDRAGALRRDGPERFEIIVNAPAGRADHPEDFARCHARTFQTLRRRGVWFTPEPGVEALTTPAALDRMFPGSGGAIYGRSPEGSFAAFQRPGARTKVPGLYLAGGGAHPGAGVPMAALSGRHAAEAVMADQTSVSMSGRTAMPGGIWTRFRTTGRAPSR